MMDTVGKAFVKELASVYVEGGEVFIYQVETQSDNPLFSDFYIVTFYGDGRIIVGGAGRNIILALKNAEINWDRIADEFEGVRNNPFREAIEIISNINIMDLTSGATIKEVDEVDVGDGKVVVYEVKSDNYDLDLSDLYIATFLGTVGKEVWGAGDSPKSALKNAERVWDIVNPDYNNPFREAIEMLNEEENNNILLNY